MKQTDCFRKKMGDGDARCRRGDRGRNKRSVGRQRAIMETCGCCLARATKLEIWFQNAVLPSLPVIQLGFSTTWWDTFGWSGHSPTRRAIKEIESKNYIYWLAPICPVLDCYFDVILLKSGALKVARLLKHRSGYYKLVRISVGYLRLTAFFFPFFRYVRNVQWILWQQRTEVPDVSGRSWVMISYAERECAWWLGRKVNVFIKLTEKNI